MTYWTKTVVAVGLMEISPTRTSGLVGDGSKRLKLFPYSR